MPYIARDQRGELDEHLAPLIEAVGDQPGKLSYALYVLLLGHLGDTPTFATYAETIGTVEAVKLELARDRLGRREDLKKLGNGPVEVPR